MTRVRIYYTGGFIIWASTFLMKATASGMNYKEKAEKQRKQKWSDIKEAAKTDPEATRVYEEHLASIRERNRWYKEESEARAAVDPKYAARQSKLYRIRLDRQNAKKKTVRAVLKEKAKTDETAARESSEMLSAEAVVGEERRTVQEQRMAEDPKYAEHIAARQKEYDRRHVERRSADLKELKAQAAAGDPEAAAKLEAHRQAKREQARAYYYRKKAEKKETAV